LFPDGVGAEIFPVLLAGRHVIEAGHVHEVGHVGAGEDGGIENRIEAESLEERDLAAFVKHLHFVGEVFFCRSFVAAEFIDAFRAWPLQGGGDGMVWHVGEGLQEDRLHAEIGRVVIGGFEIVFSDRGILRVAVQGCFEAEPLFQVFEWDEDIDVAGGGCVVVGRFENTHFRDTHSVQGGQEGGLEPGVDPGFLFCRFQ